MQELLDDIQKYIKVDWPMNKSIRNSINKALEKEKEQIIEAYENGKQNGMDSITNIHMYIIGEKYYNQTYNQKSIDAAELLYNIVKKEVAELNKDRYNK